MSDLPKREYTVLRPAGHVGVPGTGQRVCPTCKGHGQDMALSPCDRCDATGVVAITQHGLTIGMEAGKRK